MKTVDDMRTILSEQIDGIRNNTTTISKANAIVNAIGKYLHSVRLQLEYCKLQGTAAQVKFPMLESRRG
jgi:hypothetical protein